MQKEIDRMNKQGASFHMEGKWGALKSILLLEMV